MCNEHGIVFGEKVGIAFFCFILVRNFQYKNQQQIDKRHSSFTICNILIASIFFGKVLFYELATVGHMKQIFFAVFFFLISFSSSSSPCQMLRFVLFFVLCFVILSKRNNMEILNVYVYID